MRMGGYPILASMESEPREANARVMAAAPELLTELQVAVRHIEHMAAWISKKNAGYSFEGLGEDMPGIRAAIAKATAP